MTTIRLCRSGEYGTMVAIINAAAEAYRGVIPSDCWHEPYMSLRELETEIAAGVTFFGYEANGQSLASLTRRFFARYGFELKSALPVSKSTGHETCSWTTSHFPFIFL